jgi:integrase/recombinase XerD
MTPANHLFTPFEPAAPSESMPAQELIHQFARVLPANSNYTSYARQFVMDCLSQQVPLNEETYKAYIATRKPFQVSPLRRFWFFYQTLGCPVIIANSVIEVLSPAIMHLLKQFADEVTGLADNSLETYSQGLTAYFTYASGQNTDIDPFDVLKARGVQNYIKNLVSRDKSAFTINLHLSAIKQLATWCIRKRNRLALTEHQIDNLRDIADVKGKKTKRTFHKDSLDTSQRDELLTHIDSERDLAILYLLSYEGLRTIEVTRLRLENLDFERKLLHVQGKGRDDTSPIKFFQACLPVLKAYLEKKGWWPIPVKENRAYLFDNGKVGEANGPMKTHQIRYIVDKALRKHGLKTKGMSAHSLRHTVGQLLIEEGIPLEYVQQHLRHATMETTQIYTRKKTQQLYFDKMPE